MNWKDLVGKRVAALVSGGLDSTSIIHWLSSKGVEVLAVTVDLGQPDETNMEDIPRRMKAAGAKEAIMVDGKELLAEYMMMVIQGQASYEGGYWNTTGIARMATVKIALPIIWVEGINVIIHGATGRGNDQVRFELGTGVLQPEIQVYAPWRDEDFLKELGGRKQMIEYCQKNGLEIKATLDKPYSTDANFCGLTHEAGKLESLKTPTDFVKFLMTNHPKDAPDEEETVSIEFLEGEPISLNGRDLPLLDIFLDLNSIAGRHGVGILDVVENRRVGIKSRGIYEAPGVAALAAAYEKILQLILDRRRRRFFDFVSRELADAVYRGEWFYPLSGDLLAAVKNVAKDVTGTVVLKLYKGNIIFVSADVPYGLYDPEISSMEKVGDFNHADSQGYLNIANVLARTLAEVEMINDIF